MFTQEFVQTAMNVKALPLDTGGARHAALALAVDIPFTVRQAALFLKCKPANDERQSVAGQMA